MKVSSQAVVMALKKEFVTVGADGTLAAELTLAPWSIACVTAVAR